MVRSCCNCRYERIYYIPLRQTDAAMHEAVPAIAACGVSPIVRIPDNQGFMVKRELPMRQPYKVKETDNL